MQRKNKKILGAVQTRAYPLRSSTPMPSAAPFLFNQGGADVENNGLDINNLAGGCALGGDDLGTVHYGKYLHCTMSREAAEQECLDGMNRSILAGYVVLITILFLIGGITIWVCL